MPSIDGGDSTSKDYAPHMWIGDHFIHNSGQTVQIGDWWYRAGKLSDESIVAERWQGEKYRPVGIESVSLEEMPEELLAQMESISRAKQYALQKRMEEIVNRQ